MYNDSQNVVNLLDPDIYIKLFSPLPQLSYKSCRNWHAYVGEKHTKKKKKKKKTPPTTTTLTTTTTTQIHSAPLFSKHSKKYCTVFLAQGRLLATATPLAALPQRFGGAGAPTASAQGRSLCGWAEDGGGLGFWRITEKMREENVSWLVGLSSCPPWKCKLFMIYIYMQIYLGKIVRLEFQLRCSGKLWTSVQLPALWMRRNGFATPTLQTLGPSS